jgi:hypothetical protein
MKLRSYCAWSAELVPLEKITQWPGKNNEIEDTWYEEIEEHQQFLNPYYAVVELEKGKRYPLPYFFESRIWSILGCCRDTATGKFCHLKDRFPAWVIEWVNKWSMPIGLLEINGGKNET